MGTELVDGILFAEMVKSGAHNLEQNRTTVNELNVFPIPDGDTGDNMYMTIDSGAAELSLHATESVGESAAACARGMLLGARGNSGVILSRIFAGIARGLDGLDNAGLDDMCRALEYGIDEAYGAVAVPVEGTMLTVFKDAVHTARAKLNERSTLESFFGDFVEESRRSLERTPELLDVLREAGVVDSGGAGLIYIAEGMRRAVSGDAVFGESGNASSAANRIDISKFTEESVLEFGYCTEFLLRLQTAKCDIASFDINDLVGYLNSVGDSVVAFADGSVVKVHVHTMTPGDILNHCQKYGEFLTLKIENMTLQHNETAGEDFLPPKKDVRKKYAVVSVSAGEGLRTIFSELGCDVVVNGGQSMNPSAEDFIRAFDHANADTVFVFPNNSNVILTARQAASLYEGSDIRILPTKTVGEGYAAISMLDYGVDDADEIVSSLSEIIESVVTGFVSRASRESTKDGVTVHDGDYIGFCNGVIHVSETERAAAVYGLCEKLDAKKYDVMLLICGEGAPKDEVDSLYKELSGKYPRTEVITLDGGQPIYDYIIILE